jgi:outer membrane protein
LCSIYFISLSLKGQYDGFASQFRNNRGEYLALTLSIPIYNSDRWHNMKKARNNWQLAQVNLEETRRKLHDQIAQAIMDAEGYAKELHQMHKKVASDSLAYHMSSRKFEEGMLSTFDLHTSAQTLLESRIKELQMQMLLVIKQRLVGYYQGERLIK